MSAILENPMQSESDTIGALARRVSAETVIRANERLAKRTTLHVGGPADYYTEPASEGDLAEILKFCAEHQLAHFILGRGSNLLIRDGGFRGVVIALSRPCFNRVVISGERLICGAGAKLKHVAVEARNHGLSGMEFLEGIPGSVGGALRMNAGAMGGTMFDVVESMRIMDAEGVIHELAAAEIQVEYRSCPALKSQIALGATLKGRPDSQESIGQRMIAFSRKRWASQPAAPSAGCIFKNPPTIPAGKLIDELGLKGARFGGAFVSSEHGNFVVTDGTATARDVLELIELIRRRALEERGIDLCPEVEIVGED